MDMACSGRNLLKNGGFRRGVAPWRGRRIRRLNNPLRSGDYSIFMSAVRTGADAVLQQTVYAPFERGCAYYLYFRLLNVTPSESRTDLYATVAYLNKNHRIIRSTPLLIRPPVQTHNWYSYFTIVPPPPRGTRMVSVVFLLGNGSLFVDYIRFASHVI
ncbi:hypothetical protein [Thermoactinomyces mirandus]|uniref:Uncharacterized protein n=1 Tax=Thermoactinomyces mirandus TaxID=2756294 RepID=A0A7W1XPL4_9BACL|nr:hypothetical protein [Thermoactinomyces mirandus]MBA4600884.1 hypothetical protein [Thermoactinomyces mirandus]